MKKHYLTLLCGAFAAGVLCASATTTNSSIDAVTTLADEAATPQILAGYPAIASVSAESAIVTTSWNVAGSLYATAFETSESTPSVDDLLALHPTTIEANTTVSSTFNFLETGHTYRAAFLLVTTDGAQSQVVESVTFTPADALSISFTPVDILAAGDEATIAAVVEGGVAPYTYSWLNKLNQEVSTNSSFTATFAQHEVYHLTVTSADGQTATAKTNVVVEPSTVVIAGFDDLYIPEDSHSVMYDLTNDPDTDVDSFVSGSFIFPNYPNMAWSSWNGYGYANDPSNVFNSWVDQFRTVVGGGAANTEGYGVAYYSAWSINNDMSIIVSTSDEGLTVPGMYITNSAYTANSILNGDGWNPKFTKENQDYYTITFVGYDAAYEETGRVAVNLADFRDADTDGFVLTSWQWVDLSTLGNVNFIDAEFSSTQLSTVPTYFCFDELGATRPILDDVKAPAADATLIQAYAGCLSVIGVEGAYNLNIYSIDGVKRAAHRLNGDNTISTANLAHGNYIVEIVADNGTKSVKKLAL